MSSIVLRLLRELTKAHSLATTTPHNCSVGAGRVGTQRGSPDMREAGAIWLLFVLDSVFLIQAFEWYRSRARERSSKVRAGVGMWARGDVSMLGSGVRRCRVGQREAFQRVTMNPVRQLPRRQRIYPRPTRSSGVSRCGSHVLRSRRRPRIWTCGAGRGLNGLAGPDWWTGGTWTE